MLPVNVDVPEPSTPSLEKCTAQAPVTTVNVLYSAFQFLLFLCSNENTMQWLVYKSERRGEGQTTETSSHPLETRGRTHQIEGWRRISLHINNWFTGWGNSRGNHHQSYQHRILDNEKIHWHCFITDSRSARRNLLSFIISTIYSKPLTVLREDYCSGLWLKLWNWPRLGIVPWISSWICTQATIILASTALVHHLPIPSQFHKQLWHRSFKKMGHQLPATIWIASQLLHISISITNGEETQKFSIFQEPLLKTGHVGEKASSWWQCLLHQKLLSGEAFHTGIKPWRRQDWIYIFANYPRREPPHFISACWSIAITPFNMRLHHASS